MRPFLFLPAILLFISCDDCEHNYRLTKNSVAFYLFDKSSGENLIGIGLKYRPETFLLTNESGDTIIDGLGLDGLVVFRPFREGGEALDTPLTKRFYAQLNQTYNPTIVDIDTIQLDYEVSVDECDQQKFTYVNFYYNEDSVIFREDWKRDIYASIVK